MSLSKKKCRTTLKAPRVQLLWNKIPFTLSVVTVWLHQECIPHPFSQIPAELIWSQPPHPPESTSLEKESFLQTLCNRAAWIHNPECVFFLLTCRFFFFLFAVPFESCCSSKQAQQIKCHVKQKQARKLPPGCTAHLAEQAARGPDYPCQWKRKWESGVLLCIWQHAVTRFHFKVR